MSRSPILMFVCIFAAVVSFAQSPKSLLWRISGKGLKEPSYLYGTMHISNKEVFRFGDSVYKAIERSQGLAIEINPDEMAAEIVRSIAMGNSDGVKISEKMDRKDFDSYKKGLSKKFKKDAEEITTKDILKEKNKWIEEYIRKGEMPTFMDAFLYNIARKQGKWIGGIEDLTDQTGLHEELFDKSDLDYLLADQKMTDAQKDKSFEEMIRIYVSEDIDKLLSYSQSDRERDIVLIKRNVKMARRMDSLSSIRTMFFAVGAAHLAGDSGVIDLLRKRGFKVDPVFSSSKIDASKYKYKEISLPWVKVDHSKSFYSISMPMKPTDVKLEGLIDCKMLMDLFTNTCYFTFSIAATRDFKDEYSLYDELTKKMFPNSKDLTHKNFEKDGMKGREYTAEMEEGFLRLQAVMYEKLLFINMIFTLKKSSLKSPDTDKFFTSFKVNKQHVNTTPETFTFRDNMIGISVDGPGEWTYSPEYSNKVDATWDIDTYLSIDQKEGAYTFLTVKQPRISRFLKSDSFMYRDLYATLEERFKNLVMRDTMVSGMPSVLIQGDDVNEDKISLRIISSIRGNKIVSLMTICEKDYLSGSSFTNMHKSFQWIPAKKINWKLNSDSTSKFITWAPDSFSTIGDDEEYKSYSTLDSAYGTSYTVTVSKLNRYEWSNNESEFWKGKIDDFLNEDDRVISTADITNGKFKGKEILVGLGKSSTRERIRFLLAGDQIITMFVSSSPNELLQENVNRFMTEFRLLENVNGFDMFSNKTSMLLRDLASKDSITKAEAMSMMASVPFTESDIPALKKAYLSTFKNQTESQLKIIDGISNIKTQKSFKTVFELLKSSPVPESLNSIARNNFIDTLSMAVKFLPEFIKLGDNIYHGPFAASMVNRFLDSGYIRTKEVLSFEPKVIALSQKLMSVWNHPDSTFDYHCYSIVELLPKINTDASIAMLKKMQSVAYPYFKKTVAIKLATFNIKPEAYVIDSIMKDPYQKIDFYDELKDLGKVSWIPAKYLVQREFADAYIKIHSEDDYEPETIEFIETRELLVKDKKYKFYFYKVTYDYEDTPGTYLGVAGGFEPGSDSVDLSGSFCHVFFNTELNDENLEEVIKEMLEDL